MTFVLDLDAPTYHFEVSVWHYASDHYSVDSDRGTGRCTVYETDSKDKALGVAEYLEQNGRYTSAGKGMSGSLIENTGEPFTGSIVHWDCSEIAHHRAIHDGQEVTVRSLTAAEVTPDEADALARGEVPPAVQAQIDRQAAAIEAMERTP